jgi:hypothetical protein
MEYPSLLETAFALFRAVLYSMACVCAGAALIALALYGFLACSEIFFSHPDSRALVKVLRSARLRPVAGQNAVVFADDETELDGREHLPKEVPGVTRMPVTVAATVEGDVS